MIKLIITIKETKKIQTEAGQATGLDINYEAEGKHSTSKEMEVLKMFEDKLQLHRKTQIINKCTNDKIFEELIEKMMSSI